MDSPDSTSGARKPDRDARFGQLYGQLRSIARRELGQTPRTSLQTTALVHEAYLKLAGSELDLGNRAQFLALAAKAMRYVLVDHVRARVAAKRGGALERVPLETGILDAPQNMLADVLEIDRGLQALGALEPRLVTVVECRFFAGMEFGEIAEHLQVSERTAQRDWRRARAFLQAHFGQADA